MFIVGRDINSDITINSKGVSFHHLFIEKDGNEWYIIDNNSTNGTYLNDYKNRISKAVLKRDDTLYLSTHKLSTNKIFELIDSTINKESENTLYKDEILIGRDPNIDIVIDKLNISWHHSKITTNNEHHYIEDLKSTNGTLVNNKPIDKKIEIYEGDRVTLGIYNYIFKTNEKEGIKLISFDKDGIRVDVKNVYYSVNIKDKNLGKTEKILLDDISFTIYPSEIVGIMGLSGAGKTTLLNILSGYSKPTEGQVFINGRDLYKNYDIIKNFIGFVPQDDIIHPELTVYESLFYSSKLRLKDLSDDEIDNRIDIVLKELGIYKTKDVLIGSPDTAKGISGGQRKRVNIAMELLSNPELIFLDEPTSGLSSVDTKVVMDKLKELSDSGKTVILTIHQPSLSNYKKMDNIIILTHGKLAYFGANYPNSIEFFNQDISSEEIIHDPDNALLGLDNGEKNNINWQVVYKNSDSYNRFVKDRFENDLNETNDIESFKNDSSNSFLSQLMVLTKRYLNIKLKDRVNTIVLFIQSPIIALLLIFLFAGEGYEQYENTPSILLFILIISAIWFGVINSVREIVSEKAIFNRERLFGLKILPYILSKFIILSILSFIQVSILIILVNSYVPLNINIFHLIGLIFLTSLSGLGIGLFLSAIAKSASQALAIVPIVLLPMIIFAGGMIPIKDMPTNRIYIDAYRVSMLMPTRWSLEEVLREFDNYNRDPQLGLREPIYVNCNDFNQSKYPTMICKDYYNALYPDDIDFSTEGCEGKRCIEDNYIDLIDNVWRNTPSYIIYIILVLYVFIPLILTSIILKKRSRV